MFKMKNSDYESNTLSPNLNEFLSDMNLLNGKKKRISIYGHKIWSNNMFFDASQATTHNGSTSSHQNNNNNTNSNKLTSSPPLNFSFLNDKTDEFIESLFSQAEKDEKRKIQLEITPNRRVLSTVVDPRFTNHNSNANANYAINTINEIDGEGDSDSNMVPTVIDLNSSLNNTLTHLSETSHPSQSSGVPMKVNKLNQLAEPLSRPEGLLKGTMQPRPRLSEISNRLKNQSKSEQETNILFQLARVHSNSRQGQATMLDPITSSNRKSDKNGNVFMSASSDEEQDLGLHRPRKKNIQILKKINLTSLRRATFGAENNVSNPDAKKKNYIKLTASSGDVN